MQTLFNKTNGLYKKKRETHLADVTTNASLIQDSISQQDHLRKAIYYRVEKSLKNCLSFLKIFGSEDALMVQEITFTQDYILSKKLIHILFQNGAIYP